MSPLSTPFPRDEGNQSPVSNEQPSDEESKAPINEADPDPLPATQREEATESQNETSEDNTTSDDKREAQIEDPDPDLLPATQDEVTAESKKEASEDEATTQLDNPVEALLESLPEDKREEVQGIWALWNEMDEIDHEQWISHQTQTTEIVNAIVDNLEKHKYKGIVAAIHNYADVRLNDEFDYSESMNLLEFLTVEDADGNKKWHQFLEGEFDCEDYRKVDQSSGTSST